MAILNTSAAGAPYPDDNEYLKDVPDFIRQLAVHYDLMVISRFDNVADRNTKIPSPVEGILCWMKDTNTLVIFDGTTWMQVYPSVPRLTSGTVAPSGSGAVGDIYVQF